AWYHRGGADCSCSLEKFPAILHRCFLPCIKRLWAISFFKIGLQCKGPNVLRLSNVGMSNVPCHTYLSHDPTTRLPIWSVGGLTNTCDMGRWTSQHLTAESASWP